MSKYVVPVLVILMSCLACHYAVITVTCGNCTSFNITFDDTVNTFSEIFICPAGTFCNTAGWPLLICAATNTCNNTGVTCGSTYAVFPSSNSCQQYYVCRGGVLYTLYCPGTSKFDSLTNKCTLSSSVVCST